MFKWYRINTLKTNAASKPEELEISLYFKPVRSTDQISNRKMRNNFLYYSISRIKSVKMLNYYKKKYDLLILKNVANSLAKNENKRIFN